MVLNLLRVEGINPEFMLENSFYQFQNYDALPQLYESLFFESFVVSLLPCTVYGPKNFITNL